MLAVISIAQKTNRIDKTKNIINDNLHHGNTLDPDTPLPGQSEKSQEFMKLNFSTKKDDLENNESESSITDLNNTYNTIFEVIT